MIYYSTNSLKIFLTNENFFYFNLKIRLERGVKSIFVPHSPGVYVSITLNSMSDIHGISNTNFDSNFDNKFFKCNAILNLNSFDNELRDLLMYLFLNYFFFLVNFFLLKKIFIGKTH